MRAMFVRHPRSALFAAVASIALVVLLQQPWHQGTVHIGCSRDGSSHAGHESDQYVKQWEACDCQHACDPNDPSADETGGRRWDPKCRARCAAAHCHCGPPCKTTENAAEHWSRARGGG